MTRQTVFDILSTKDLENLDSFLKAWDNVIGAIVVFAPGIASKAGDVDARRKECDDLRRKLAVAIHYSKGGLRP